MPTRFATLVRILFDNNVPFPLRRALSEHTVRTAAQLKWETLKNGDLLSAAEAAGFDLMVTADQNLTYQQNLAGRTIALVVLASNNWSVVSDHVDKISAAIKTLPFGGYIFLEMSLLAKPPYKPR